MSISSDSPEEKKDDLTEDSSDSITKRSPSVESKHSRHSSSKGATTIIRKRLNFTDEGLWKKFTTRRLQLVESLSLSSKKASEQFDQINLCAHTLMMEFGFSENTLPEFDKLVRLAIQSVRRNKKRSEKRLAMKLQQEENGRKRRKLSQKQERAKFLSSIIKTGPEANGQSSGDIISGSSSPVMLSSNSSIDPPTSQFHSTIKTGITGTSPSLRGPNSARLAIGSLIAPQIHDPDRLPSIKQLPESPEFAVASQKILQLIKKSKTCYEFSCSSGLQDGNGNYELLEQMGSSCISAAVLYTLEKWFDHLLLDSASYIKLRLKSDLTLSLIVKNLDRASVEVSRLGDYIASQLFKKLIGGCVKDFGFDCVLFPLCNIFRSVITKDYPLLSKETKMHQWLKEDNKLPEPSHGPFQFNSTSVTSHPSLPLPGLPSLIPNQIQHPISLPPIRNKLKTVTIEFNGRELKLFYSSRNNAPPTVVELLTNSRTAFSIVIKDQMLRIKNKDTGLFVNSDVDLEKIFRSDTSAIHLQLVFGSGHYLNLNQPNSTTPTTTTTTTVLPLKGQHSPSSHVPAL